jgi:hypothetical protein
MVASSSRKRHQIDAKQPANDATAVAEEMVRRVEDTVEENYSRGIQESIEFNQTLLTIARANMDAYFEWIQGFIRVTSLSEFIEMSTDLAHKQFQRWSQQARELFALGEKASIENMGPLVTIIGGALVGRPDLS